MPAGGCDFHTPLGSVLSQDVRKIQILSPQRLPGRFCRRKQVRAVFLPREDSDHVGKRIDPIDFDAVQLGRLRRRKARQHYPLKPFPVHQLRNREASGNLPHAPVQAEFAHQQEAPGKRQFFLPGSGDYAGRYRQVIAAAVFVDVCGSQVYHYALARDMVAHCLQGRGGAEQAFLHRHVRKSDEVYSHASVDVGLHCHESGIYAQAFSPESAYQHNYSSATKETPERKPCIENSIFLSR